jgi:5-methyltetrahydrofolate--homocysteine methyltransferase
MLLLDRLQAGDVLVADGAMGTMLMSGGLKSGDCPERINLDRPELLSDIARLYGTAGADVVQTNTFGGSPLKLAQYDLEDRTEEINAAAVRAVKNAVGPNVLVSGSCGPCGRLLEPYGDANPDDVEASFARQMSALVEAEVDVLCIETMMDLVEAQIAVRTAKKIAPSVPVMATMTFDSTQRGFFTIMGVSVADAAVGLADVGADIVGSNCGNGTADMVKIAAEFRQHTDLPLLIQPNAGLPKVERGLLVYPETPEFMASHVTAMIEAGVNIIGGCCGSTPDHIAAIRSAVDAAVS